MKKQRRHVPQPASKHRTAVPDRPVVNITNLSYSYPGQSALTDVSISVSTGERLGVLGPNGSGKSTLFRILSTLLLPSEGGVEIDGIDILQSPDEGRRRTGIVFQSSGLDPKLTVAENLSFHGHFYGLSGVTLANRVHHLLQSFGLLERKDHRVEILSGGLQRRVELARGLLHKPAVLVLDEPSTGLDPAARLDFWQFLSQSMKEGGMTVLLTTHLLDEAERCDRVAILDRGRIVVSGTPAELKASLGGDIVVITASDPHRLAKRIRRELLIDGTVVDRELHLETKDGARLIPRLVKTFSASMEAVTIRKPGLQDVFLRKTGHQLGGTENDGEGGRG
ncbi:MAG: ABC transporter ATP-binding protein [Bacteroidota bacterium]